VTDINGLPVPECGEPLSKAQFRELMKIIEAGHRFAQYTGRAPHCKHIKYITPILDLRDSMVFRVSFRGLVGEKTFDFRDGPQPMFDRIKKWLEEDKPNG